jgi:nitrite reductase/ring-hydroxylating ferredoxin subunit
MKKIILGLVFTLLGFVYAGCDSDPIYSGECFVPEIPVNITLNMSLPEYFLLQNTGEYRYVEGGNRGVFVVHNYDDLYYAIERTCTYQSDNACAKIFVDSTTLQLKCGTEVDTGFVECCNSRFLFDSRVVNGPARCNLKTYRINLSGTTLYINN